jgi:hypothetical protein
VIYTDAYIRPQTKNGLAPFCKVAQSEAGLARDTQDQCHGAPMRTISMIIALYKKAVAANTNASFKRLQKKSDFAKRIASISGFVSFLTIVRINHALQQLRSILIYAILSYCSL